MTFTRIQNRRGTAAEWTAANPTLARGEFGIEYDTGKFKLGNGTTAWTSLAYFQDATGIVATIVDGAPSTLNTLNEIAAALDDDANILDTLATRNNPTFTGTADFTGATVLGIDALPSQSGQVGKYLTTDGSDASWATIDISSKQDVVSGVSSTEIGYLDGVTSAIQTQLNARASLTGVETLEDKTLEYPTIIGASAYSYTQGTTVMNQGADFGGTVYDAHSGATGYLSIEAYGEINFQNYISAGDVVYLVPSSGTSTLVQVFTAEAGFAMFDIISPTFNVGDTVTGGSFSTIAAAIATPTSSVTITSLELGYLNGVSSNIQTQLGSKAPLENPTFTAIGGSEGGQIMFAPAATSGNSESSIIDVYENSMRFGVDGFNSPIRYLKSSSAINDSQMRNITLSTSAPSGGQDGDVWLVYTP